MEIANLVAGALLVAITVIDCVAGAWNPSSNAVMISRFLSAGIFLNSVHVYFTFALFLQVPQLSQWAHNSVKEGGVSFTAKVVLIFAGSFLGFLGVFGVFDPGATLVFAIALLFQIVPVHHGVSQNMGISLLYNKKARSAGLFDGTLQRLEKTERLAFNSLIGFYLIYAALFFAKSEALVAMNVFYWLYTASAAVVVISGVWFGWRTKQFNKSIFLLRVLLFPLVPFSFIALMAIAALHGIEYLAVARTLGLAKSTILTISAIGILLVSLCPYDGLTKLLWPEYSQVPVALRLIAAVAFALTVLHYYMDRLLFATRVGASREFVFPLLLVKK